jgi:hypothetical protein
MHHGIDLVFLEEPRYQRCVAHLPDHELPGRHRLPESLAEIIENDHSLASLTQLPDHVTADISGPAGDEDAFITQ